MKSIILLMYKYKHLWRRLTLGLPLLGIIGPWVFDHIIVPSQYPCSDPFIRLEGDYCGAPLSGIWMLWAIIGEFVYRVKGLIIGITVFTDVFKGLYLFLGALLLVLPLFSTSFLILTGTNRLLQIFNLVIWGVATGLGMLIILSSYPNIYWELWGRWVYIITSPINTDKQQCQG